MDFRLNRDFLDEEGLELELEVREEEEAIAA